MSNKICPNCQTTNSTANLKCIKCSENMLYVPVEVQWTTEHEKQPFRKIYLFDEFRSFSFIARVILCITFTFFSMVLLNPLLFASAIIILGTFFIPKDFDYFSPGDWHDYFLVKNNKKLETEKLSLLKKDIVNKESNTNKTLVAPIVVEANDL